MPQMGDLLQGFLYRTQEYEQEETAQEEKKRQKLEDQLSELKFTGLQREMGRNVERFRREQAQGELLDEALARIQAGEGTELDRALMGLKMPEVKMPGVRGVTGGYTVTDPETGEVTFRRTQPEKEPGGVEFGTVPSGMQWITDEETGQLKLVPKTQTGEGVLDITRAMKTLYPTTPSFEEFGEPVTPADSLWKGLITEPRTPAEEPFFGGKKRLESVLREFRPEADITEQKKGQIDQWLDAGYSKEEIRATIKGEEDRLTKEGIDVQELYKYLGF